MTGRWAAVLLVALGSASCAISVDTSSAAAIPTGVAVPRLYELLPKSTYIVTETKISADQRGIEAWVVTEQGLEIRIKDREPFRLAWSDTRGAALSKQLGRYELRVYGHSPRREVLRINWGREDDARRAVELFEALRGDH